MQVCYNKNTCLFQLLPYTNYIFLCVFNLENTIIPKQFMKLFKIQFISFLNSNF